MKRFPFIVLAVVAVLGAGMWFGRVAIRDWWFETRKPELPESSSYNDLRGTFGEPALAPSSPFPSSSPPDGADRGPVPPSVALFSVPTLPSSAVNLAVPFTSQAPYGVWDAVHEDTCEEAAVLMVDAFFDGRALTPDSVEAELLALVDWQKERFGYFEDTSAAETAVIAREFYDYQQVEVRYDIVMDDIREVVRGGLPVIIPLDGRMISNPFYSGVGPEYHMLVIRGLTADGKFITNDPGTRRGEAYLYDPSVLWEAIYDWNGGSGFRRKVMIVIHPKNF